MAAFNEHWDSTVIPPVDPWIGNVLDAGQGLADAAGEGPTVNAWLQALGAVPAAWRNPGNIHPAG